MQNENSQQSIFIITGMPRSGTSFTASLLQNAGLDIGQRLMASGHGNIRGFFENLDFVDFHEMVLRSQGLNHVGWILQDKIDVEEQHVEKAKEIITKNSRSPVWGWKDPRTTLFLDFWLNLLPNAKFLLVYRSPWEVVDSIYRRGDSIFIEKPELAVKIWINYNRKVLKFYEKFSQHCLLASIYNIVNKTQLFIETINAKFNINLSVPKPNIYEQSLLQTQVSDSHKPTLISHCFPDALEIYQELNTRDMLLDGIPNLAAVEQIETSADMIWAFQDWLNIRRLETEVKNLRSQLERVQSQLNQT